jgi:hypothetical protein
VNGRSPRQAIEQRAAYRLVRVWPATAFDDSNWGGVDARGWAAMTILTQRRDRKLADARAAQSRLDESSLSLMTAASLARAAADRAAARWREGPNVLALLFAHPDSDAIGSLDTRGEYLDHRSGDLWDLFFPGYYVSQRDAHFERGAGARPVGSHHLADWYFHSRDFNLFRAEIEGYCDGRWRYSGGTDLVVASGWLPAAGKPRVDWRTTISGSVTDETTGVITLSLPEIIERISQDLELALESPTFGLDELTPTQPSDTTAARDVITSALGGILAALGAKALGA